MNETKSGGRQSDRRALAQQRPRGVGPARMSPRMNERRMPLMVIGRTGRESDRRGAGTSDAAWRTGLRNSLPRGGRAAPMNETKSDGRKAAVEVLAQRRRVGWGPCGSTPRGGGRVAAPMNE